MTQQNTEDRLAALEDKVAALEHEREIQADRDIALLARVDSFIDTMRRMERVQLRMFDEVTAGQKDIQASLVNASEILKDHKSAIESLGSRMSNLEAGQQQILNILLGNPPIND